METPDQIENSSRAENEGTRHRALLGQKSVSDWKTRRDRWMNKSEFGSTSSAEGSGLGPNSTARRTKAADRWRSGFGCLLLLLSLCVVDDKVDVDIRRAIPVQGGIVQRRVPFRAHDLEIRVKHDGNIVKLDNSTAAIGSLVVFRHHLVHEFSFGHVVRT